MKCMICNKEEDCNKIALTKKSAQEYDLSVCDDCYNYIKHYIDYLLIWKRNRKGN